MNTSASLHPTIEYHLVNTLQWPSLRPLQKAAIIPVRSATDCVLVAPTAGGKTEAALFPLLTQMEQENWTGTSVLYVAPLRALLNNLHPRVTTYASWLGRTVGLWHGDVSQGARKRMLSERPDVLLTTPESLEAMLVSRNVDHRKFLGSVNAVVIDELHSFAAGDRGWHMLGVLERIERIAGRTIQRIGLSATVGNPDVVGRWLQGSTPERGELRVVRDEAPGVAMEAEITLDYVGSLENAALVISRLYRGEKRLVFCESRKTAELLTFSLRELGVETFVSHSSLSADERRLSEQAFAEGQNTVIVATSTLELGVDIGDLDRVIQIDAPRTVSSFLQRLGRTGRRPGTRRNTLFLTTSGQSLMEAAAILLLWKRGFVEDVLAPPHPRHLAAQQLLAVALQEGYLSRSAWQRWWRDLSLMDDGDEILTYLREHEFFVEDEGRLMIGPKAEKEFGHRHFIELLSSFIAEPELRVLAGQKEVGFVSPLVIPSKESRENQLLVLAGRGWQIDKVDWDRFTVNVTEVPLKGRARWQSGTIAWSYEVCQAQREILLGAVPEVTISKRVPDIFDLLREEHANEVSVHGLIVQPRRDESLRWWTWAGLKANATLAAALGMKLPQPKNEYLDLPSGTDLGTCLDTVTTETVPWIPREAVTGLKFAAALPVNLATRTLARRLADPEGARLASETSRVRLSDVTS
ncbi:DEAD/DEAH box helicase [Glutamicibacter protophormiae]